MKTRLSHVNFFSKCSTAVVVALAIAMLPVPVSFASQQSCIVDSVDDLIRQNAKREIPQIAIDEMARRAGLSADARFREVQEGLKKAGLPAFTGSPQELARFREAIQGAHELGVPRMTADGQVFFNRVDRISKAKALMRTDGISRPQAEWILDQFYAGRLPQGAYFQKGKIYNLYSVSGNRYTVKVTAFHPDSRKIEFLNGAGELKIIKLDRITASWGFEPDEVLEFTSLSNRQYQGTVVDYIPSENRFLMKDGSTLDVGRLDLSKTKVIKASGRTVSPRNTVTTLEHANLFKNYGHVGDGQIIEYANYDGYKRYVVAMVNHSQDRVAYNMVTSVDGRIQFLGRVVSPEEILQSDHVKLVPGSQFRPDETIFRDPSKAYAHAPGGAAPPAGSSAEGAARANAKRAEEAERAQAARQAQAKAAAAERAERAAREAAEATEKANGKVGTYGSGQSWEKSGITMTEMARRMETNKPTGWELNKSWARWAVGLPPNLPEAEIAQYIRKKILQYHPDKVARGGTPEDVQAANVITRNLIEAMGILVPK